MQIDQYKMLLDIEKQRSALYKERSEFYVEQSKSKDQLFDQQSKLVDKLVDEAKKKSFWKSLAIGEIFTIFGFVLGIFAL